MSIYDHPAPEKLSLTEAQQLAERICIHWRPALFDQLQKLHLQPDSFSRNVDLMVEEQRLTDMDAYAERLERHIHSYCPSTSADAWPLHLSGLHLAGTQGARASAAPFFTPESRYIVHSPVLMAFAAALAGQILAEGEHLTRVARMSFTSMIRHHLHLQICDAALLSSPPSTPPEFHGVFETSQGRRLKFQGYSDFGQPVALQAGANPIAQRMLPQRLEYDAHNNLYRFPLRLTEEDYTRCNTDISVLLMSLMDVLIIAFTQLRRSSRQCLRLLATVRGLPLSVPSRDCCLELRMNQFKARSSRAGVVMIPFDYRFLPWQTEFASLLIAETGLSFVQLLDDSRGSALPRF